jgi:hypothetical protein
MSAAHRILGSFDIKATSNLLAPQDLPDELMIDWTGLPRGSHASIYLPSVSATAIAATARERYGAAIFTAMDAHTVACTARGIAYLPIPRAPGNLAGFIDVSLPASVKQGHRHGITLRQLTTVHDEIGGRGGVAGGIAPEAVKRTVVPIARRRPIAWRKGVGDFQLALVVSDKAKALHAAQDSGAILGWILAGMASEDRWRPVIIRYLEALAGQIRALGGEPGRIKASPFGASGARVGQPGAGDHGHGGKPCGDSEPHRWGEDGGSELDGKIDGLVYDHFGDFEGFILEADAGSRRHFVSRERAVEDLAREAWAARLRVTIVPEPHGEHELRRVILHPPRDRA